MALPSEQFEWLARGAGVRVLVLISSDKANFVQCRCVDFYCKQKFVV